MVTLSMPEGVLDRPHELFSILAHELRAPVASVVGVLDLMSDPAVGLEPAEVEELMAGARADAHHLLATLENLLSSARIATGSADPQHIKVRLANAVEEVLSGSPQVRSRALVRGKATAIGDPDLIRQVITNLIQNVFRYAPTGAVEILLEENADRVRLYCADEGPGIDPLLAEEAFTGENNGGKGLRLGLGLSRDLARMMGGDLWLGEPIRSGATLVLDLPVSSDAEPEPVIPTAPALPSVLPPKGRLLVDVVQLLTGSSLDIEVTAMGLERLACELIAAEGITLLARRGEVFQVAGRAGQIERAEVIEPLVQAIESVDGWLRIEAVDWPLFEHLTDTPTGYGAAVRTAEGLEGLLLIGWSDSGAVPQARARGILDALRFLAGLALDRTRLADDLAWERELRSVVMDALPIAISIFAGDPLRVVDWNTAERRMLGINDDSQRPHELELTQAKFDVRFTDGTPLDLENAPVVQAVRKGEVAGPFYLRMRRLDGSDVYVRTHCAPFFENSGEIAGAVVTSEIVEREEAERASEAVA